MQIMSFGETDDQAAMMMEPSAAWIAIVAGFLRKVAPGAARVAGAEDPAAGRAAWRSYRRNGEYVSEGADYVLNCIPMHLLAGIEHNFPAS